MCREPLITLKVDILDSFYERINFANARITYTGVVLTHANLTAGVISNLHGKNWNERGCLLSYLPLAHIFEVCGGLGIEKEHTNTACVFSESVSLIRFRWAGKLDTILETRCGSWKMLRS